MPCAEKKSRVRFTYLVATRILRSWRSRNAVATSSRSAMLRTSIQACGTATTTLAKPKPSPSISTTRCSASGIISRTRSSPVTPRWTAPCASCVGDFGGREIRDLDAGQAGDRAAIVAGAARLDQLQAGAREERLGVLLQPALGGHGEDQRRAHGAPPLAADALDPDRKADRRDRRLARRAGSAVRRSGRRRPAGRSARRPASCSSNTKPV